MKKQTHRIGNYIVLFRNYTVLWSLASALLLATAPAVAQDDLTDETSTAQEDTVPADTGAGQEISEADDSAAPEPVAEDTSAVEPTSAPQFGVSATTNDSAEAEDSASSEAGDTSEAETPAGKKAADVIDTIGIRVLSSEAYPTFRTRGIKGGSLWRTFHGLQWPYMPKSGIGVSGTVWVDTGYEKIDRSESSQQSAKYILQEGRAVLRVTPTYSWNRWFVQGQAELVANKDQNVSQPQVGDTDDLWIRMGMWHRFDIQAGRFEAWELYHLGMGLDLNTQERRGSFELNSGLQVPDIYGVTGTYYRPSGPGNIAAHIYPADFFRVELLGQMGNDGGLNSGAFRGAGILDFGFLKLKGGGEYAAQTSTIDKSKEKRHQRGFGGTAQFVIKEFLDFGGSYGWSITDHMDSKGYIDQKGSVTTWSAGGFLNARIIRNLLIGGGAHYTFLWDIHKDENNKVGEFSHLQAFGAIQYLLFDRLYIKVVGAYAQGNFSPSFSETKAYATHMISGRLRLQYDF